MQIRPADTHRRPKVLVIGHARHGKDTVAEQMTELMGLKFVSSSFFVAEEIIWPLWGKDRYSTFGAMFDDRVNYRSTWFNLIAAYNTPDMTKTASTMFERGYDIYVGMRRRVELEACKAAGLFDAIIWVDRSKHHPPEELDSMELRPEDADVHLDNNGNLQKLNNQLIFLQHHLRQKGYDVGEPRRISKSNALTEMAAKKADEDAWTFIPEGATPVLDHGFIILRDHMGNDHEIAESARMSYGRGTKKVSNDVGLLRYLMLNRHTSPFEMCLSGDTRVPHFSPEGVQVKTYTMKELADAFEHGGKENSWVKLLRIRTVNPDTGVVTATKIKRAWKTGTRAVYEVVTKAPFVRRIKMTDNHRVMVPGGGFATIASGLSVGSIIMLNGVPALSEDVIEEIQSRRSKGQTIKQVSEALDVSESVVFKYAPGKAARKTGFLKKPEGTHDDPRAIARRVKNLTICEAIGCDEDADHVHHVDENPQNNDITNLMGLCTKHHKHAHHLSRLERTVGGEIESITYIGVEDVYDLETVDPNHTFVAEGIVVHNCEIKVHMRLPVFVMRQWVRHRTANLNEYSGRYSEMPRLFYIPRVEQICGQHDVNKQGSGDPLPMNIAQAVQATMKAVSNKAFDDYELMLKSGVSRETARIILPLNTYTEIVWKIDINNLVKMLLLRDDDHAQWEIQVYAKELDKIFAKLFPETYAVYRELREQINLTKPELLAVVTNTPEAASWGLGKGQVAKVKKILDWVLKSLKKPD